MYKVGCTDLVGRIDEPIPESLMISLEMIMGQKFGNGVPQATFTEEDDSIQAGLLDRPDKPLRVSVQVRRSWRQLQTFHAYSLYDLCEFAGVQRVPVVEEQSFAEQKTVYRICEISI